MLCKIDVAVKLRKTLDLNTNLSAHIHAYIVTYRYRSLAGAHSKHLLGGLWQDGLEAAFSMPFKAEV